MLQHKVNEWQELSLKKDVEIIKKSITSQSINSAITISSLGITAFTMILNKYGNGLITNEIVTAVILSLIVIANFCIFLFSSVSSRIKNKNQSERNYSVEELIDSFDNEICFCVMTANSYCIMLEEMIIETDKINKDLAQFYYIETWYYLNRAKAQLFKTLYQISDVFASSDTSEAIAEDVVCHNKISKSRLINIVRLIDNIQIILDSNRITSVINKDDAYGLRQIHIRYDYSYQRFLTKCKSELKLDKDDVKSTKIE